jgi:hypothetical protein
MSRDASCIPPQRIFGRPDVPPPVWPDELKAFALSRPQQTYGAQEEILARANGWTVLRGDYPARFGDVPFTDVSRVLMCPSAFVDETGQCVALLAHGRLYERGDTLAPLGDVVVDLLPWPGVAFLIRPAPKGNKS